MTTQEHIICFSQLSLFFADVLKATDNSVSSTQEEITAFKKIITNAAILNPWFTEDNIHFSLHHWTEILTEKNLSEWVNKYDSAQFGKQKKIGVIMAGNIPMVGFHDMLSVLISGNVFIGKLSAKDDVLLKATTDFLIKKNAAYKELIFWEENKLTGIDAIIATGSNNTARYFEYYFGKYPNIIRKSRNSVAILSGKETVEEMTLLGDDIFLYFGLGCRNVSKIFVPENYDFAHFFQPLEKWNFVANHNKYRNNYEYNRTILLMNNEQHLDNGFLLLKESKTFASPIAVMFYEHYKDLDKLKENINFDITKIQCVVSNVKKEEYFEKIGTSQQPKLWEYSDNIDTLAFLYNL